MADATDSTLARGSDPDGVARFAAHLLELDLDARSLEILMAALTVDACDQVDLPDD